MRGGEGARFSAVGGEKEGTMARRSKATVDQRVASKAVHPLQESAGDKVSQFHVLAVDDSHIDRKLIEKLLKTSSYKVTSVDSALRALEVLGLSEERSSQSPQAFEINLIITDYCMPLMTGYDLLKRVKETSGLKEIPVVIMSSENVRSRIEDCKAEGAEDFILKPVQLEDVKRLRGFIRGSRTPAVSMDGTSASACSKRKMGAEGTGRQVQEPERRNRFSGLPFS